MTKYSNHRLSRTVFYVSEKIVRVLSFKQEMTDTIKVFPLESTVPVFEITSGVCWCFFFYFCYY